MQSLSGRATCPCCKTAAACRRRGAAAVAVSERAQVRQARLPWRTLSPHLCRSLLRLLLRLLLLDRPMRVSLWPKRVGEATLGYVLRRWKMDTIRDNAPSAPDRLWLPHWRRAGAGRRADSLLSPCFLPTSTSCALSITRRECGMKGQGDRERRNNNKAANVLAGGAQGDMRRAGRTRGGALRARVLRARCPPRAPGHPDHRAAGSSPTGRPARRSWRSRPPRPPARPPPRSRRPCPVRGAAGVHVRRRPLRPGRGRRA